MLKKISISQELQAVLNRRGMVVIPIQCKEHGRLEVFRKADLNTLPECPKCKSVQEEAKSQRESAKQRWQQLMKRVNIAPRFVNARLYDFNDNEHYDLLSFYVDKFKNNLGSVGANIIIHGPVGPGKTHLACAIASELFRKRFSIYYVTTTGMIRDIRSTWHTDSEQQERDVLKRYTTPDLLILDEIGVQYGTESERLLITDVIDQRSMSALPVIAISNLQLSEIRQKVGQRAFDRLSGYESLIIPFSGQSRR